jgi:Sec-independent protein translocase protein TatA
VSPGFVTQPLDLLILALVAFLILGPNQFPQAARSLGRTLREARNSFSSLAFDHRADDPTGTGLNTDDEPYVVASFTGTVGDSTVEGETRRSSARELDTIN